MQIQISCISHLCNYNYVLCVDLFIFSRFTFRILHMIKLILAAFVIVLSLTQYNPELSKNLCSLTVASYCKSSNLADWSCAPCKNSALQIQNVTLFINSTQDTLGFISVSKKLNAIVIVFRGTQPWLIKNWIADINFIAINYPLCDNKCKVHEGFYHSFMDIHTQVMEKVIKYKQSFGLQNIIVVGHSLGAALATHCAAHLIKAGHKISLLQTYGSPRVGDKAFTSWFQQILPYVLKPRITHGKDPVPHLPFEDWGFQHIQTEVFYQNSVNKGYKVCNDQKGEDKTCSEKFKTDTSVVDHLTYYDIDFAGIILACQ